MLVDALTGIAARVERDVADGPILPKVTQDEIRGWLTSHYDFTKPVALEEVVGDLERMLRQWNVQVTHPRYFGLFNPSVTLPSVVADTLVALYNPQLATWRTSPAANEIERHTLRWLADKFQFPPTAVASFTTGGAESNLSAVLVALTRAFPAYGEQGLRALPAAPTIYLTGEAHHSFSKIAQMTGIGRAALRPVAVDATFRMDPDDLARQVAADRRAGRAPFMVVATAGTTGAGAIDPLADVARVCEAERLWLHVDAAWGGAAMISPRMRRHFTGIDAADSITCDAHKWFSVPMGAGTFFCRHPDAVAQTFHAETSYMPAKMSSTLQDPYTSSVQWSRRFIGLKLFTALATFGEAGYVGMIERQVAMGDVLRSALRAAGWTIVNDTPLPLVCFTRDNVVPSAFLAALYERQIAWMSEVRLNGGAPVLRACITSYRTTEADVHEVVDAMSRLV